MSLALFGFDELEAKLYYLNTGKHINENLLITSRPLEDSNSSSAIMDEESTNQGDTHMEEADDAAAGKKDVEETALGDNVPMMEDITDDELSIGSCNVEEMEIVPEQKPDKIAAASSEENEVTTETTTVTETENTMPAKTSTESVTTKEVDASTLDSHENGLTEITTPATPESKVSEPSSDDVKNETEDVPDKAVQPAEMESEPTEQTEPVEDEINKAKEINEDEINKAKEINGIELPQPKDTNSENCNGCLSSDNNNKTATDFDRSLRESNRLKARKTNGTESVEQIQRSCKQCYVKLYKMPMAPQPADLLRSCKACYVRLNKLHLNDLLLSCRQCSVVVPKLAQHVHD